MAHECHVYNDDVDNPVTSAEGRELATRLGYRFVEVDQFDEGSVNDAFVSCATHIQQIEQARDHSTKLLHSLDRVAHFLKEWKFRYTYIDICANLEAASSNAESKENLSDRKKAMGSECRKLGCGHVMFCRPPVAADTIRTEAATLVTELMEHIDSVKSQNQADEATSWCDLLKEFQSNMADCYLAKWRSVAS